MAGAPDPRRRSALALLGTAFFMATLSRSNRGVNSSTASPTGMLMLSGAGREAELRAKTQGFQAAFAVAFGLAAFGALLAVLLFRPRGLVEDPTVGADLAARKHRARAGPRLHPDKDPMERRERFEGQCNVKSIDEVDGGI